MCLDFHQWVKIVTIQLLFYFWGREQSDRLGNLASRVDVE